MQLVTEERNSAVKWYLQLQRSVNKSNRKKISDYFKPLQTATRESVDVISLADNGEVIGDTSDRTLKRDVRKILDDIEHVTNLQPETTDRVNL